MSGTLFQDLHFAVRSFLRAPRFSVPAVLALALGIGAAVAVFSVVRGVMLEPLPYRDPDRVVSIWEANVARNRMRNVVGAANFIAWVERNRSFEHLGMVGPARFNMIVDGQPSEVTGLSASSEVFRALGVEAAIGRVYGADEDLQGRDAVVVLSHEFWQTRLGGRDVIGSTVVANQRPRTVVGIMPPGFTIEGQKASFYAPYGWTVELLRAAGGRGSSHAIARLRDGVTLEQARDDLRGLMRQLEQEAPGRNAGWSAVAIPIHELTIEPVRPALLVLSGAVALVLLIACVNVANLLLARGTVRQRELGLRTALGAGRSRLLRQLLTESLLLALLGGVAGLVVAYAFHRGLLALVADQIPVPRLDAVTLDLPIVLFALAVAAGTGILFGIVPALIASGHSGDALREGGRHGAGPRARRVLGTLVAAEVALALVLLTGAGLLLRSFTRLQNVDPGFRAEGVLTARVSLPGARYGEPRQISDFYVDAVSRIRALPGVRQAAGITFLPLTGPGIATSFYRLDRPEPADGEAPVTDVRPVTPRFYETMNIPLLAGRDFTSADSGDAPAVAIVSDTLARQMFPGENPLGRRLHVNIGGNDGMQPEIVGIVGDVKFASLDSDNRPAVYFPHPQLAFGLMTFVVRTDIEPSALSGSVVQVVRQLDPELAVADVRTLDDVVAATLARPRAVSAILAAFALMALLLASVGIYGVMAYSVSQRTQEIGVRMALGASVGSVFRLVMGHALRLVGAGVVTGLAAAALLTRVLDSLLFQTEALDLTTFAATALMLAAVATIASWIPARRGARIAPVEALRAE